MAEVGNAFESAEYLASWAAKEAANFTDMRENLFAQPDVCSRVTEFDADSGKLLDKLRVDVTLPMEMRGVASNVIKNYRDALDQATYAATFLILGRRSNRAHFPFGESPDDLEESLSLRRAVPCKGLPEQIFPALRACEPYPTGNNYTGGNDPLRLLGRVSGNNKHAITITVNAEPHTLAIGKAGGTIEVGPGGALLHTPFDFDRTKKEAILFSFPPGGYVKTDIKFSLSIIFGPGPLENWIAEDFFDSLADTVPVIINRVKEATADIIRQFRGHNTN